MPVGAVGIKFCSKGINRRQATTIRVNVAKPMTYAVVVVAYGQGAQGFAKRFGATHADFVRGPFSET
jgi:hypothetical protein